jgi:hypothetical protein
VLFWQWRYCLAGERQQSQRLFGATQYEEHFVAIVPVYSHQFAQIWHGLACDSVTTCPGNLHDGIALEGLQRRGAW